MNKYDHQGKFSILAFLTLCAFSINAGTAQPVSRIGAFTNCIDSNGDAFLCTQSSWDLAFGYSASRQGDSASLIKGSLNKEEQIQECSQAPRPSSLEIKLSNPDLRPGDKIYLEDFIIEVFDKNGDFIPEVPVIVYVLSQEGMLETDPNWDYIEVFSYGHADFFAESYCSEPFGRPGISESTSLTVTF